MNRSPPPKLLLATVLLLLLGAGWLLVAGRSEQAQLRRAKHWISTHDSRLQEFVLAAPEIERVQPFPINGGAISGGSYTVGFFLELAGDEDVARGELLKFLEGCPTPLPPWIVV